MLIWQGLDGVLEAVDYESVDLVAAMKHANSLYLAEGHVLLYDRETERLSGVAIEWRHASARRKVSP